MPGTKTSTENLTLIQRMEQLRRELNIAGDANADTVAKVQRAHDKGITARLLKLADPATKALAKAERLQSIAVNSDPDVVEARTRAEVHATLTKARTLCDMGANVTAQYQAAKQLLSAKPAPEQPSDGSGSESDSGSESTSTASQGTEQQVVDVTVQ